MEVVLIAPEGGADEDLGKEDNAAGDAGKSGVEGGDSGESAFEIDRPRCTE